MNEAKSDYLDPKLLNDADAAGPPREELSGENEELKTIKRAAISPTPPPPPLPPPPRSTGPRPPPTSVSSPPPLSLSSGGEGGTHHGSEPAPGVRKPSWLRSLLTTSFPPPSRERLPGVHLPVSAQTAGTAFAVLGLLFAVVALVTGLRGAPSETLAPAVAAALVIARALVALGAGALSFAMFRQAERLLVDAPPARS
jgi:hypothetical protein